MTTDVLSDTDVSLKVVSNASGRMRVCVTGFNVDAVRAVAIEETVSQVTGVHAVHAYPRTASVVIWYSPELGAPPPCCRRSPKRSTSRQNWCPPVPRTQRVCAAWAWCGKSPAGSAAC